MNKRNFLSVLHRSIGFRSFIVVAYVLALVAAGYTQDTRKPFLTIVIPGINATANPVWVANATVLGPTPKRYRIAEPPRPRENIPPTTESHFLYRREPTHPVFGADQSLYIDPNNPDDIKRLKMIAAEPNVQVVVDMNLGLEFGGAWKKPTEWGKKVVTILAETHKEKF